MDSNVLTMLALLVGTFLIVMVLFMFNKNRQLKRELSEHEQSIDSSAFAEMIASSNSPNVNNDALSLVLSGNGIIITKREHHELIERAAAAKSAQEQVNVLRAQLKDQAVANIEVTEALQKRNLELETENAKLKTGVSNLQVMYTRTTKQSDSQFKDAQSRYEQSISELKTNHQAELERLRTNAAEQQRKLESMLSQAQGQVEQLNSELRSKLSELSALKSDNANLAKQRETEEQHYKQVQAELEKRLSTISDKLVKEGAASLEQVNQDHMGKLLNPLKEELSNFRDLISQTQQHNAEQSTELKNELRNLQEAQLSLSNQTDKLTEAMLNGQKSHGIWGEHKLQQVLELAGLEQGSQFESNVSGKNSAGEAVVADVIVRLPNQHGLIIKEFSDLIEYTTYVNADQSGNSDASNTALNAHVQKLTELIDKLSTQRTYSYEGFGSPAFIFLFLPVDHSLGAALRHKSELYNYAHKKDVYLVSPSTLIPALRVVSSLWMMSQQSAKMKDIVSRADHIYQKCQQVGRDFEAIVQLRDKLDAGIDQLATSLNSGRGNLKSLLKNFALEAPYQEQANVDLDSSGPGIKVTRTVSTSFNEMREMGALLSKEKLEQKAKIPEQINIDDQVVAIASEQEAESEPEPEPELFRAATATALTAPRQAPAASMPSLKHRGRTINALRS